MQELLKSAATAIHRYYDANRPKLMEDYQTREAMRAEQEKSVKANPPVPKDTVINFWPAAPKQIQEMLNKGEKR